MKGKKHPSPEFFTANILTIGVILSSCLLILGIGLPWLGIASGVALLRIGLWVLMLVPLFGIIASLIGFVRLKEAPSALIASSVLFILVLAILTGLFLTHPGQRP